MECIHISWQFLCIWCFWSILYLWSMLKDETNLVKRILRMKLKYVLESCHWRSKHTYYIAHSFRHSSLQRSCTLFSQLSALLLKIEDDRKKTFWRECWPNVLMAQPHVSSWWGKFNSCSLLWRSLVFLFLHMGIFICGESTSAGDVTTRTTCFSFDGLHIGVICPCSKPVDEF